MDLLIVRTDISDLTQPYFLSWAKDIPEFVDRKSFRFLDYDRKLGNLSYIGFSDSNFLQAEGFFVIQANPFSGNWKLKWLYSNPSCKDNTVEKQLFNFALSRAALSKKNLNTDAYYARKKEFVIV